MKFKLFISEDLDEEVIVYAKRNHPKGHKPSQEDKQIAHYFGNRQESLLPFPKLAYGDREIRKANKRTAKE